MLSLLTLLLSPIDQAIVARGQQEVSYGHSKRSASNLEWALAHRHAFIVGGGNDPTLALKYVHKQVVPALLNDSSLWADNPGACHVVDVGAASYGPATGYDYSDSLLFLGSLGGQCLIHAFDLSASKLLELRNLSGGSPSLRTHHIALGDRDGNATVRSPKHGGDERANLWSIADDKSLAGSRGELRALTFDSFAKTEGIRTVRYAKVDVQGHDPRVALGMRRLLHARRVGFASFEYSNHWQSPDSLASFQAWAQGLGYSTYLVAADAARQRARLVRASGVFWRPALELCTPGSDHRCVIDLLIVKAWSALEQQLLWRVNGEEA